MQARQEYEARKEKALSKRQRQDLAFAREVCSTVGILFMLLPWKAVIKLQCKTLLMLVIDLIHFYMLQGGDSRRGKAKKR